MTATGFSLDFPRAYGDVCGEALFRVEPEDFQVSEDLGFSPSGEGGHLYLHIEKRNQNTRWVAGLLSEAFAVQESAIGYCGLKDRRALTRQWFSVQTGITPSVMELGEGVTVLSSTRHQKKLRRGMHAANRFVIRLREFNANSGLLAERLELISHNGVPNYFGPQRFGFDGDNLNQADELLGNAADRNRRHHKGKNRRLQRGGIYISAARSYLFNLVLAQRVRDGSWNTSLDGEARPEGPLWGRGRSVAAEAVTKLEQGVLRDWQHWCTGLEFSGLQQERRALVLKPEQFSWQWLERDLQLSFTLPPGTYATALLSEIALLKQIARSF